jgi:hypothetical protein
MSIADTVSNTDIEVRAVPSFADLSARLQWRPTGDEAASWQSTPFHVGDINGDRNEALRRVDAWLDVEGG